MGSLFSKIFLSFWLTALLLGGAFFAVERHLGEDYLARAGERMDAHAETAAALLAEGGEQAVSPWLERLRRERRPPPALLDEHGRVLGGRLPRRLTRRLEQHPPTPGSHPLRRGMHALVRAIPGSEPPRYLLAVIHRPPGTHLPAGARLAIAVPLSGLICLGLAALITRPVRRLRGAAQALAAGDLSVRVGYRGRDEIAALARDFDTMAARLRDLLEAQRRLLRDVSHELRSPLARLRVALELARKTGDSETALTRIGREADRLESLVADTLSLARLESGQSALDRRPVDLTGLVASVVQDADFEARAADRRVTLEAADGAGVAGDPVLLRAAIENVVRNAVRHTAKDSTVEVRLSVTDGEVRVAVCDRGPGVPAEELERLFEPFTRVGQARDRASGGYGLGLAIGRRAAQAHGGGIRAANRESGGLCVALWLPLADG
jgi:signal transduction histidine kinase